MELLYLRVDERGFTPKIAHAVLWERHATARFEKEIRQAALRGLKARGYQHWVRRTQELLAKH